MDVKEFFDKVKEICNNSTDLCSECLLVLFALMEYFLEYQRRLMN